MTLLYLYLFSMPIVFAYIFYLLALDLSHDKKCKLGSFDLTLCTLATFVLTIIWPILIVVKIIALVEKKLLKLGGFRVD